MFDGYTWGFVIVLIILLLVFSNQVIFAINSLKATVLSVFNGQDPQQINCELSDDDDVERYQVDPKSASTASYQPSSSDSLMALGYSGNLPWDEVIQTSELDPSTFINHQEFVKDVRRFSSGANFTSICDDNVNLAYTNFIGLRRPEHVTIGESARQVPDVNEDVLKRNRVFRWNSTS